MKVAQRACSRMGGVVRLGDGRRARPCRECGCTSQGRVGDELENCAHMLGIRTPWAHVAALGVALFWTVFAADALAQGSVASDRAALEALYDAAGGASWTNSTNWKTSARLDDWHGVTTDAARRVTELALRDNNLAGSITPALGDLANLRVLILSSNELTGPIPDTLEHLASLYVLNLAGNQLSDAVPAWLGNMVGLQGLYLSGNKLTGPVPPWLGNLSNIQYLSLGNNALTGGIPATLGDLANLRVLSLNGNELTGRIPDELENLVDLERLSLSYNWGLSGSLPPGLRRLSSLESLRLWVTQACAPSAWKDWLQRIMFLGRLCEAGPDVTIDVAVVYTPAAREATGGRWRGRNAPRCRRGVPGGGPPGSISFRCRQGVSFECRLTDGEREFSAMTRTRGSRSHWRWSPLCRGRLSAGARRRRPSGTRSSRRGSSTPRTDRAAGRGGGPWASPLRVAADPWATP